jgi:putative transposase
VIVAREDGKSITLLTNDLARSAVEIGALHRGRWRIELLFRWLRQHLKIRKFLGADDSAIRLQLLAAMIAFALIRIVANAHKVTLPMLRFIDLIGQCLFGRQTIGAIERPPPVNPSKKRDRSDPNQICFAYA